MIRLAEKQREGYRARFVVEYLDALFAARQLAATISAGPRSSSLASGSSGRDQANVN
ncbi:hypothetical protein [Bradyrhizobium iriomotense]|uniref:hypothetical protein n=1 Tax=Bradyrhizobium iriomotense TaxID=441950 RepID=UPI001B8A41DD|nr:hypothetical protein [Bradyrhizobium iriomotense]MBR1130383.1 hypothetical protein [Bradyrhizobium iriomotense]